jgi:hypothetical protein
VQVQFGVADCASKNKNHPMATGNAIMLAKSLFEENNNQSTLIQQAVAVAALNGLD